MTINATGNRMTAEIARQSRLAQGIARSQISISTGKRFETASQDPLAAARVVQLVRTQSDDATFRANLNLAASLAAQADQTLSSFSEHMVHARELMVAGASNSATAADRATYAAELRGIASDVAALRTTTTSLGTPLFAPAASTAIRVDRGTTIVPVSAAPQIFERSGIAITSDLTEAAAALESGDPARIGAALDRLGSAVDHVADAASDQGVRAARIDRLIDTNAARGIDTAAERSQLEDTDLSSAITTLNAQQLTLEAAQAAFARINRRSLFDILG